MSGENDLVAVPTNGHGPGLTDPEADRVEATDLGAGTPTLELPGRPRPTVPAVSPGQLAAGFGILAALILIVLGRRRGRR